MMTKRAAYTEMKTPRDLIGALINFRMPEALYLIEAKDEKIKEFILECLSPHANRPTIDDLLNNSIFGEGTQERPVPVTPVDSAGIELLVTQSDSSKSLLEMNGGNGSARKDPPVPREPIGGTNGSRGQVDGGVHPPY
jgi:hypothetical protein